jgi:hypothetical protein
VLGLLFTLVGGLPGVLAQEGGTTLRTGVCPPFALRDELGRPINPVTGENADQPYSPKQTCGVCHDYDKITQGYHFTQGAGEGPTTAQSERVQWATTPGLYGGNWCSPAPLYCYLSPKTNASARTMDLTSFTLMAGSCGDCHPGGGSAEYDREGKRYDAWMADPASGLTSGGENGLDGDYYKARWTDSGVLEADCLMCHTPEYSIAERSRQKAALNLRWAATAGSGLAKVSGSVKDGTPVEVSYDKTRFAPDGKLMLGADGRTKLHLVREPRDEACLGCHAQPGWKKRGSDFRARTDVHIRAGLKCVDCHPAGSSAADPRISGYEEHQIGKGDDPGGLVRDDLDNTVRSCSECHSSGYLGAPIPEHEDLPETHLEAISCQACHIPQRAVAAAMVQAGDVLNPGPHIPVKNKPTWTFYGPDMRYLNHYANLGVQGYDDKPTSPYRPVLTRYKGLIYPVNRVHSAWPAIETAGVPGLMEPAPQDIQAMWVAHQKDASAYPALAAITDDNGDLVPEVNRPEEIDALIASVTEMLTSTAYPMEGKRVLWVMDDRAYASGTEFRAVPKEPWEASPYANTHKYSHEVYPARAALGARGCADCHAADSPFLYAPVVQYPFGADAKPVTVPQWQLLDMDQERADLLSLIAP